jgi:hypothetical protein
MVAEVSLLYGHRRSAACPRPDGAGKLPFRPRAWLRTPARRRRHKGAKRKMMLYARDVPEIMPFRNPGQIPAIKESKKEANAVLPKAWPKIALRP